MHVSSETTIADTFGLTPENYRRELTKLADQRRARPLADINLQTRPESRNRWRRAGKTSTVAIRRPRPGRQVLIPGKRKAARHPWADRLEAARTGGFVIDQTHSDSNVIVGSCYGCGHRFGFVAGDPVGESEFEREVQRHQPSDLDSRECMTGVTL